MRGVSAASGTSSHGVKLAGDRRRACRRGTHFCVASPPMRPPSRILTAFALTLASACAGHKPRTESAPPSTTEQAAQAGIDAQALLAVELEPQASHKVVAPDKSFKATVEASSPPQV